MSSSLAAFGLSFSNRLGAPICICFSLGTALIMYSSMPLRGPRVSLGGCSQNMWVNNIGSMLD